MKYLILALVLSSTALAGGGSGGTPPALQLEAMVLSERVILDSELAKLSAGGSGLRIEKPMMFARSTTMARSGSGVMESLKPAGILVNVAVSDFKNLTEDAESGRAIFYHEAQTQVSALNHDTGTLILRMVDDPNVVIVVQPDVAL